MTKKNEKKIATFSQKGKRINLLKVSNWDYNTDIVGTELAKRVIRYQVRLNRKVQKSSISEYECRKVFAKLVINTILQLNLLI